MKFPSSIATCNGPQALEVEHGVATLSVALENPYKQDAKV